MRKFYLFLIVQIISSCFSQCLAKITIFQGHFNYQTSKDITLSFYNDAIDYIEKKKIVISTKIDENNDFKIKFNINHPVMVNVKNGNDFLFYNIIFSAGDSINMKFDTDKYDIQGNGENEIAFMFEYQQQFQNDPKTIAQNNSSYTRLEPVDYAIYWNKGRMDQLKYFKHYFKDTTVSSQFKKTYEYEINYQYGIQYLQYAWRRANDYRFLFSIKEYFDYLNQIVVNNDSALVSISYVNFLRELPYSFWTTNIDEHNHSEPLSKYFIKNQYRIRDSIAKKYFTGSSYDIALYSILYEEINWLSEYRGHLYYDAALAKTNRDLKNLGKNFKDKNLHKRLKLYLKKITTSNKTAPDFEAFDVNGNKLKLSDFRGKVIYLDFWATNCAPCVRELPAIKILQETLKEYDDLVFLYISFDNKTEIAKKFIEKNNFKGTHLFAPGGFLSMPAKAYSVSGIPRCIIIDKKGNLISDNAPRPSEHPESILLQLLKE